MLASGSALAQQAPPLPVLKPHMHHAAPADRSWYPGLIQPGRTASCCGDNDCRLSRYCSTAAVPEGIMVGRACVRLPYELLVAPPPGVQLAPEEVHVCHQGPRILCVIGGAGV